MAHSASSPLADKGSKGVELEDNQRLLNQLAFEILLISNDLLCIADERMHPLSCACKEELHMLPGQPRFKSKARIVNLRQGLASARGIVTICAWLAFFLLCAQAHAQGYTYTPPRFETGLHFTGLHFLNADLRDSLGERPAGFGGRFTYNHLENLAFEGEINYFPEDPSGDFGETEALVGVKAGGRFENIGLFGKVRPGFIHFGGDALGRRLSERTQFACDLGGVIEYYPSPHWLLRMDVGDTIIPFHGTRFISFLGTPAGPTVVRLGTTHNFQASFGFAVRF